MRSAVETPLGTFLILKSTNSSLKEKVQLMYNSMHRKHKNLTLQEGGAFKAPPEQNRQFKHLQLSRKNLTFPRILWGCLSYPLGGSKQPKKGFL